MRNLLLPLLLLFLTVTATAQPPVTGLTNTRNLKIEALSRTDTRLTIDIRAVPYPNQVFHVSSDTYIQAGDRRIPLEKCEGVDVQLPLKAGQSGILRLCFAPVEEEIQTVDLVVSPAGGNFRVWDIDLTGKPAGYRSLLPAAAASFVPDTDRDLPEPVFQIARTTVNLHIMGLREGYDYEPPVIAVYNPFSGNMEEAESVSVSLTELKYEFRQYVTTTFMVKVESRWVFYLTTDPGETVDIYLDLVALNLKRNDTVGTDDLPYVYFTGNHAGLNTEHAHQRLIVSGGQFNFFLMSNPVELTASMSPEDFIRGIAEQYRSLSDEVDRNADMSRMMKQYAKAQIAVVGMQSVSELPMIFRFRNRGTEREHLELADHPELFSLLHSFDPDRTDRIYSYGFYYTYPSLGEKARAAGASDRLAGEKPGYSWLAAHVFPAIAQAQRMEPLTEEQQNGLPEFPAFYREVYELTDREIREAYQAAIHSDAFEIRETPDVEAENLLEAILAEYPGKAVFVDFWATWCGPCINAMRTIRPLKPEMKANDVVIVYITSESSPKTRWSLMLPEIGGRHYYLTEEQWAQVSGKYGIEAIPSYLLFDKNKELSAQFRGFPGVEKLTEELRKMW